MAALGRVVGNRVNRRHVAAVLGLVLALLLPLGAMPPASAEPPPAKDGSEYVATCLQSARSLSALFLFDQSGSLGTSDPNGIRYDGLRIALKSLARVNRGDGVPVAIEAAVSAFDDGYFPARDVVDWTRLNDGDSDQVNKTIDDIVARAQEHTQPNAGTNFTEAMQGAWNDVKDRGSRGTCRVIFWFTDGADGVNTVGSQPCMPDSGLLDQMRKAGIVVVGLQLGQQTDDLKAISTGSSASVQCGSNPIPADWAPGVYIQADDSAALRRLFGTLGNVVRGCTPQGDRKGNIDPGVRAMNVTINTPSQVSTVRLDAPDGTVITANAVGAGGAGGYRTVAESDESYVSVTVEFPPGKGAGPWVVSAGQAVTPDAIDFCVFSGLHLKRVDPNAMPEAGGPAEIVYHAVDSDDKEADLGDYKDVAPGAAVTAGNGDIRKATAVRDGNRIVVTVDSLPVDARLQVKLTVQLVTVSDLVLTPLAVDEGVGFKLNEAYPTISPIDQLDLGAAVRTKPATRSLTLVGSPQGPSRVCFDKPVNIVVPQDQNGTVVDVAAGCVDLAKGESKDVQVSVTPIEATVGNGEAELPIRLVPVVGSPMEGQEAQVTLPVLWRYENPRSQPVLILVVVLISLLSAALPLLAIGLANKITARFDVRRLNMDEIAVVIGIDGPRRVKPLASQPNTVIELYSMQPVSIRDRRKFTVGPVQFAAEGSLNPLSIPTFSVTPVEPGYRVLSSAPPPGDGSSAAATPGLGFLVVVVVAETDLRNDKLRDVPATLVVLIRDLSLSAAELDPLMNSKINWSTITEKWREGVDLEGSDGLGGRAETTDMSYLDREPDDEAGGGSFRHLDLDD